MRVIKNCIVCSKGFSFRNAPSDIKNGAGKYCSRKCQNSNMSKVLKEKGVQPKARYVGWEELNPDWKGDSVGYSGVHKFIIKRLGKPSKCEHCGTTAAKRFEWANVSGLYLRNLNDWVRLCTSCHRKYDGHSYKAWATRRANTL